MTEVSSLQGVQVARRILSTDPGSPARDEAVKLIPALVSGPLSEFGRLSSEIGDCQATARRTQQQVAGLVSAASRKASWVSRLCGRRLASSSTQVQVEDALRESILDLQAVAVYRGQLADLREERLPAALAALAEVERRCSGRVEVECEVRAARARVCSAQVVSRQLGSAVEVTWRQVAAQGESLRHVASRLGAGGSAQTGSSSNCQSSPRRGSGVCSESEVKGQEVSLSGSVKEGNQTCSRS